MAFDDHEGTHLGVDQAFVDTEPFGTPVVQAVQGTPDNTAGLHELDEAGKIGIFTAFTGAVVFGGVGLGLVETAKGLYDLASGIHF